MAKARTKDKSAGSELEVDSVKSTAISSVGYTVMARRYRPQDFTTLVGQDSVSRALGNAIRSGRIAHAYLFTGPRGVGKTSTARILARCLNCEKGPTPTPCGECGICQAITRGDEVDVLEIDGASNRKIEHIRELRSTVGYQPVHCRFKIYIIDEVHMLTTEAFNALLKTLEEPPPHIKFIFATTDPQDLPATILSRCQRFDFSAIPAPVMKTLLKEIIQKEGREAEQEAIDLVCRQSGGSMRDAQSLLDQALAYADGTLTAQAIHELLGSANEDLVALLARCVSEGNPAGVLGVLASPEALAVSYKQLLLQLASWWRDCMLLQAAGKDATSLNVSPKFLEDVRELAAKLGMEATLAGLDLLDNALMRLKDSPHQRLLVELTMVRMARLGELIPVGQLAIAMLELRGGGATSAGTPPKVLTSAPLHRDPEPDPKKALAGGRADGRVTPASPTRGGSPGLAAKQVQAVQGAVQPNAGIGRSLSDVWDDLLNSAGMTLSAGLLKADVPMVTSPGNAVLKFPASAAKDHDFVFSRIARLTDLTRDLTGQSWVFKLELEAKGVGDVNVGQAPAAPPGILAQQQASAANLVQARSDIEKIPLITRAIEIFHAEIASFDKDFGKPAPQADLP